MPAEAPRMQAVVYTHYEPPEALQLTEVAKPTPKDDEVLIKLPERLERHLETRHDAFGFCDEDAPRGLRG